MRAMVLAAGLGTRLAPLTHRRPKCLMPAAGRTLLGLWLERLAGWGIRRAVVNTHHLSGLVRLRLQKGWPGLDIAESHEPMLLGTGGGLVAARRELGNGPFLLINADVIATADLPPLLDRLQATGAVAVLGQKDDARFNSVALSGDGRVLGFRGDPGLADPALWRTYTGLAAIHPRLLDYLPASGPGGLIDGMRAALAAGETILGEELAGFWDDLGTPERLLLLHRDLAKGRLPALALLGGAGPFWLESGARVAPEARLEGFVLAGEGARVEAGAVIKNSLLLPGARVTAGTRVENAVLGDGFVAEGHITGGAHA
ncbi:hypothetical protein AAU61_16030 [Desulfocarbo indianensis]|nr:hypothetical protein AAU61_16030 [Desulfocarbo indianensis]